MHLERGMLQRACQAGLLDSAQLEPLWQYLQQQTADRPGFRASHLLYYCGGLLAIGAMTLFINLGWERFGGGGLAIISGVYALLGVLMTEQLVARQLAIPAGICGALVVALVPLLVYGLQLYFGFWAKGHVYQDYYRYVDWRWLMMEFSTLMAGAILLWRYRLPFLLMPVAVTLWFMSMDLAPFLFGQTALSWDMRLWVSVYFGLLMVLLAFWIDVRTRHTQDFAFWGYLFGVMTFWGGLSLMDSHSEWNKLLYCLINLGLLLVGALLSRRVFAVFAAVGIAGYLGHLAREVFADSLLFPLALSLIGFLIMGAGLWWQRHEARLSIRLRSYLPVALRELIENRAV